MTGPGVRTVADVAAVAHAHQLAPTDHHQSRVHGQWSGPGVLLSATEHCDGWVYCSMQARDESGRLLFQARFEGQCPVEQVHGVVGVALRREREAAA